MKGVAITSDRVCHTCGEYHGYNTWKCLPIVFPCAALVNGIVGPGLGSIVEYDGPGTPWTDFLKDQNNIDDILGLLEEAVCRGGGANAQEPEA